MKGLRVLGLLVIILNLRGGVGGVGTGNTGMACSGAIVVGDVAVIKLVDTVVTDIFDLLMFVATD